MAYYGVKSATVTSAASSNNAGFSWVYCAAGSGTYLQLYDGSDTLIQEKEVTAANASKSREGEGGNTWHKIDVAGTNVNANCYLQVVREGGGVFYVDGLYLESGRSSAPAAWAGYPQVYNRNDPTASNPERVDRLDIWGIPGDRPAWLTMEFDTDDDGMTISSLDAFWIAKNLQAHLFSEHMLEMEDNDFGSGGSSYSDSTCSGGYYWRFTGAGQRGWSLDPVAYNEVVHILIRARVSDTDNLLRAYVDTGTGNSYKEYISLDDTNRWELHHLATLDLRTPEYQRTQLASGSREIGLGVAIDWNSGSVDIDYILLLPVGKDGLLIGYPYQSYGGSSETIHLVGHERTVLAEDAVSKCEHIRFLGGLFHLDPGIMNRLIFAFMHNNAPHGGHDDECRTTYDSEIVTLKYRPRTRGFLP